MIETCHAILELEAQSGREALDSRSTTIFHIYRFLCDYENDGLKGFLCNIAPKWDDLSALGDIATGAGRAELAQALGQVLTIVTQAPPKQDGTWAEWLERIDPDGELSGLDDDISDDYNFLWEELEDLVSDDD